MAWEKAEERIAHMEQCFDALLAAAGKHEDAGFRENLQLLLDYYEGGQWLRDYELDEQGLLPDGLKRGVLSQDAVFHFLEKQKEQEP